jgi:hypothetical protein
MRALTVAKIDDEKPPIGSLDELVMKDLNEELTPSRPQPTLRPDELATDTGS